ncbi:MAG: hypothetical protein LBM73_03140 [Candidatus Nomurabacteria bacterium]|jgi:hypothetical protein|nr:hypothetical protein [Candidatus Nomurabacteria bacterium]
MDSLADTGAVVQDNTADDDSLLPETIDNASDSNGDKAPAFDVLNQLSNDAHNLSGQSSPDNSAAAKPLTLQPPTKTDDFGKTLSNFTPLAKPDPAKADFIKTYTQKDDATVGRATTAAGKVLDAIDAAIHDHTADIQIPTEAHEFLDGDTPAKVEKFDDAREIVKQIMDKAKAAKQQSVQAAAEAAKIYDDVQSFKRDVRGQIEELKK